MGCRNLEAGLRARDEIILETGTSDIVVKKLDLASQQSVRRFADEINNGKRSSDCFALISK
jgi:hypothetical protein